MTNKIQSKELGLLNNLRPLNHWEKQENCIVDRSTGNHYMYDKKGCVRGLHFSNALICNNIHNIFGITANTLYRLGKVATFADFWCASKDTPMGKRAMRYGKNWLRLFAGPAVWLAVEINSFYGLIRPYDANKLNSAILRAYYNGKNEDNIFLNHLAPIHIMAENRNAGSCPCENQRKKMNELVQTAKDNLSSIRKEFPKGFVDRYIQIIQKSGESEEVKVENLFHLFEDLKKLKMHEMIAERRFEIDQDIKVLSSHLKKLEDLQKLAAPTEGKEERSSSEYAEHMEKMRNIGRTIEELKEEIRSLKEAKQELKKAKKNIGPLQFIS